MTARPLDKQILALALPAIVTNITTPLLSMVDVAIVGHLGSVGIVGAVAVGGSVFSMLYWLFSFLRFGTSGITAQAVGSGDMDMRDITLRRSLTVALLASLLLVALQRPLLGGALRFIDPDAESLAMAQRYVALLIYGAPAVLAQYALTGWFVGCQDTRITMLSSLLVNVVNIICSLLFVYVLHLDIEGVALGTLVAQWAGCIFLLLHARVTLRLAWPADSRFFKVNTDIFLRTLCLISVTVFFTRSGARQGAVILAANTVLLQFFTLFSYFMDGFAFSAEAICGRLYGRGDAAGLSRAIKRILLWSLAMALLFTVAYGLGGSWLIGLLTDDMQIRVAAGLYRVWTVLLPLASFMAFTADGVAIGVTATRRMLLTMAVATLLFFAARFCLPPDWGNHGLWLAFLLYLAARGFLLPILFLRRK